MLKKTIKNSLLKGIAISLTLFTGVQMSEAESKTLPSGLTINDSVVGTGVEAQSGKKVSVHYTGWLWKDNAKGTKFDSSVDRGQPFEFPLGAGMVIKGWDEGVAGMKVGGKRTLTIPSKLGYGERGAGAVSNRSP